jgi:hypothetical protein
MSFANPCTQTRLSGKPHVEHDRTASMSSYGLALEKRWLAVLAVLDTEICAPR